MLPSRWENSHLCASTWQHLQRPAPLPAPSLLLHTYQWAKMENSISMSSSGETVLALKIMSRKEVTRWQCFLSSFLPKQQTKASVSNTNQKKFQAVQMLLCVFNSHQIRHMPPRWVWRTEGSCKTLIKIKAPLWGTLRDLIFKSPFVIMKLKHTFLEKLKLENLIIKIKVHMILWSKTN